MTPAKFACSLFLIVSCGLVAAQAQDLSGFFKGINGAFVVYDLKNDHYVRYNRSAAVKGSVPSQPSRFRTH